MNIRAGLSARLPVKPRVAALTGLFELSAGASTGKSRPWTARTNPSGLDCTPQRKKPSSAVALEPDGISYAHDSSQVNPTVDAPFNRGSNMTRLLLSVMTLADRPHSYLTRTSPPRRPDQNRRNATSRRSVAAGVARHSLVAGLATAMLIGAARTSNAAIDVSGDLIHQTDPQAVAMALPAPGSVLLNAQAESSGLGAGYTDITSIGVPTNSTGLSVGSTSLDANQSNGYSQKAFVRTLYTVPSLDVSQNASADDSSRLIALVDTRTIALPASAAATIAPATPHTSTTTPPEPAKSDVDSKGRSAVARAGNLNRIPGPSTRLIGALLACALMLRRPKRYVRS